MQDEEEKITSETADINPEAMEEVFDVDTIIAEDEEDIIIKIPAFDNEDDEIDIAFQANDEGYW